MLPNILNSLHPCAGAAPLETLDKADPPADLQAILERAYVNVLAHQFQGSIGGGGVERKK